MDVAFHLGAHCTDSDRLLRSLLHNRDLLSDMGVSVPGPGRYRDLLREVMTRLRGDPASAETSDVVLETLLERDEPARLVLSNPHFISAPKASLQRGRLYPKAHKVAWLRNIFPESPVSLFLAIRNPATFLPALNDLAGGGRDGFATLMDDMDPAAMRWSDTVVAIRDACPDCALTVWCHEDSPLLWGEIMRSLSGVTEEAGLHGGFDLLRDIIAPEGLKRLRAYTKAKRPGDDAQRRRIAAAFLGKYVLDDALEEELDLPGWTPERVAELTALYEADQGVIAALPGVRFLLP